MKKVVRYCNKCGKQMDMWDSMHGITMTRTLGYGSRYDGEKIEIDLCCDCMDNLIDGCQISPFVGDKE